MLVPRQTANDSKEQRLPAHLIRGPRVSPFHFTPAHQDLLEKLERGLIKPPYLKLLDNRALQLVDLPEEEQRENLFNFQVYILSGFSTVPVRFSSGNTTKNSRMITNLNAETERIRLDHLAEHAGEDEEPLEHEEDEGDYPDELEDQDTDGGMIPLRVPPAEDTITRVYGYAVPERINFTAANPTAGPTTWIPAQEHVDTLAQAMRRIEGVRRARDAARPAQGIRPLTVPEDPQEF